MHIASPVVEKAFLSRLSYRCDSASIAASCFFPSVEGNVNFYHFGLTKCAIHCKKMFLFLFLFFPILLLFSFFRLKELFHVKNGLTTSLPFFIFLVGRTMLNGEKKRIWH